MIIIIFSVSVTQSQSVKDLLISVIYDDQGNPEPKPILIRFSTAVQEKFQELGHQIFNDFDKTHDDICMTIKFTMKTVLHGVVSDQTEESSTSQGVDTHHGTLRHASTKKGSHQEIVSSATDKDQENRPARFQVLGRRAVKVTR